MFVATVVIGLVFHTCVTLPLTYYIATHKNPFAFMKGILNAWITALATSSRWVVLLSQLLSVNEYVYLAT